MDGALMINVDGKNLNIHPQDEGDQITYLVQEGNKTLTVIGLNEHAEWEATTDLDPDFVRAIGEKIEHQTL